MSEARPPLPPFTEETAIQKIRAAEDAWNTRDPERVSLAYTVDSQWRNRSEIFQGRPKIVEFLTRKWNRELDYRLIKELWAYRDNRIAVRFAYEYHDDSGSWFRAYGNENWEFDADGLMRQRHASINDLPIRESERKFHWDRTRPGLQIIPDSPISACDPGPRHGAPAPHPSERAAAASERASHLRCWELAGGLEPPTCCLQDSGQPSARCWRVLSFQLTSDRSSSQCAPVGPSSAWWNDRGNDGQLDTGVRDQTS